MDIDNLFKKLANALGPIRAYIAQYSDEADLLDDAIISLRDAESGLQNLVEAKVQEALEAGLQAFAAKTGEAVNDLAARVTALETKPKGITITNEATGKSAFISPYEHVLPATGIAIDSGGNATLVRDGTPSEPGVPSLPDEPEMILDQVAAAHALPDLAEPAPEPVVETPTPEATDIPVEAPAIDPDQQPLFPDAPEPAVESVVDPAPAEATDAPPAPVDDVPATDAPTPVEPAPDAPVTDTEGADATITEADVPSAPESDTPSTPAPEFGAFTTKMTT